MKYIVVVVMMCFATNSYSQMEFSSFKTIPQLDTGIKTKKVTPATVAEIF
jgi:hypothetical protein